MDWPTIIASVAASGVIATGASLIVSKRESNDRKETLQLERDKFEHQRTQDQRAVEADYRASKRKALTDALDLTLRLRTIASSVKTVERTSPLYQDARTQLRFKTAGTREEVVRMRDTLYSYGYVDIGMNLAHAQSELRHFAHKWASKVSLDHGPDGEYRLQSIAGDDYVEHEGQFYLRVEACSEEIRSRLEVGD